MPRPTREYSYDFPMPSGSTRSPPTPCKVTPSRRRRSPSPPSHTYNAPHFPTTPIVTYSKPKGQYHPSTRAAEVSRLLDPSYSNLHTGNNSGSSSSNSPLSVFVDHHGDLHDPEYRHFPAVNVIGKPKWERGVTAGDEDDDDEEYNEKIESKKPVVMTAYRSSYAYYPTYDASPVSYDSHAALPTDDSPFGDDSETKQKSKRKTRRLSKTQHVAEKVEEVEGDAPLTQTHDSAEYAPSEYGDHDWTPTCTESIRREWQAITLSLRFSIFRTKRKVKRRLGGG